MIHGREDEAFRLAAKNGYTDIANRLIELTPDYIKSKEMIDYKNDKLGLKPNENVLSNQAITPREKNSSFVEMLHAQRSINKNNLYSTKRG